MECAIAICWKDDNTLKLQLKQCQCWYRDVMWIPAKILTIVTCAEPEAVDLLLEVEQLDWLLQHVDEKNFNRTCLYLMSCCRYLPEPDDMQVLEATYKIYCQQGRMPDALRIAIRMKKYELAEEVFAQEKDAAVKKQLAHILGQSVSLRQLQSFVTKDTSSIQFLLDCLLCLQSITFLLLRSADLSTWVSLQVQQTLNKWTTLHEDSYS